MKEELQFILKNYVEFYGNQRTDQNEPLDQKMKNIITQKLPEKMQTLLKLNEKKYKVAGSFGMGYYTETPWIAIFEKSISKGAQKGFYVVFLFTKDMTGFYLSLNQGTTYLDNKFKGNGPRSKMREAASKLRNEINLPFNKFPEIDINLRSNTKNAKDYAAANICAKHYSTSDFPSDNVLLEDLTILLRSLDEIKRLIGLRELDEMVDDLLFKDHIEDIKYQEDMLLSKAAITERVPKEPPNQSKSKEHYSWERNASIAKEAIALVNYCCEVDKSHITFKSSVTKENYVEAHHLIPINQQNKFKFSVDVPGNIIALCPNCHREIHHAENVNKKKLIKQLFDKRKKELEEFGLHINISELLELYGL